jgi:hypothetical protein
VKAIGMAAKIEAAKAEVRPLLKLVRRVGKDPPAHVFLSRWARSQVFFLMAGGTGQMPELLGNHILRLLEEDIKEGRRGSGRPALHTRDQIIEAAVKQVMAHEFTLTRNPATREKGGGESACSIVAAVLAEIGVSLDERAVAKAVSSSVEHRLAGALSRALVRK